MSSITKSQLFCSIPPLLLIISAFPSTTYARQAPPETKGKTNIVIEGMVYCQSCNLKDLKPVSKATVKLKCINFSEFINFEKLTKTDGNGYFFLKVEGFKLSHPIWDDPRMACYVTLVESPNQSCGTPHVNVGSLRYEEKEYRRGYDARVYAAGPMSFRPLDCPRN